MNYSKAYVLRFLFLIYFLSYTISPLCYADTRIIKEHADSCGKKYEIENFGLLLWEVVFTKLFSGDDPIDNAGNDRLLLKKSRAVINDNILKAAPEHTAVSEHNLLSPVIQLTIPLVSETAPLQYQGVYALFSGLSPPYL